ncbi:MAG: hypothetical protein Q8O76_08025 [Chloroflexota bacterium]|nr:hypothetical protein [Chloroflexota bacterium]
MVKRKQLNSLPPATAIAPGSEALVASFREAVLSGRHWYLALLETMGKWPATEETYKGRRFSYLIGGEAFDWLLLAERICLEVDGLPPQEEKESLLQGYPPLEISPQELRRLLGNAKYRAYLNYFYGVMVERALLAAAAEDIQKERQPFKRPSTDEAYQRIYGAPRRLLLQHFQEERGYPPDQELELPELKEFAYWLFKYRLKHCERAKVASDTQRGLAWFQSHCPPPLGKSPTVQDRPLSAAQQARYPAGKERYPPSLRIRSAGSILPPQEDAGVMNHTPTLFPSTGGMKSLS